MESQRLTPLAEESRALGKQAEPIRKLLHTRLERLVAPVLVQSRRRWVVAVGVGQARRQVDGSAKKEKRERRLI